MHECVRACVSIYSLTAFSVRSPVIAPLIVPTPTQHTGIGVPTETAQQVVVGILSENSVPCTGSAGRYVNPDAFRDFIVRESAALGSPVKVPSKDQWTNFLSQPGATGSG